jgi:hypothetical protein
LTVPRRGRVARRRLADARDRPQCRLRPPQRPRRACSKPAAWFTDFTGPTRYSRPISVAQAWPDDSPEVFVPCGVRWSNCTAPALPASGTSGISIRANKRGSVRRKGEGFVSRLAGFAGRRRCSRPIGFCCPVRTSPVRRSSSDIRANQPVFDLVSKLACRCLRGTSFDLAGGFLPSLSGDFRRPSPLFRGALLSLRPASLRRWPVKAIPTKLHLTPATPLGHRRPFAGLVPPVGGKCSRTSPAPLARCATTP